MRHASFPGAVLVREQVAATVSNLLDENAEYVAVL